MNYKLNDKIKVLKAEEDKLIKNLEKEHQLADAKQLIVALAKRAQLQELLDDYLHLQGS